MNFDELIEKANKTEEPIYIEHSKNNVKAVVVSEQEYRNLRETIEIYSIPGLAERILKADQEPLEKCFPYDENEFWK